MTVDEKINQLRQIIRREGLDGFYVNGTDPHQSEYVCPRWRTRAFITGFTGSAGTVLVTEDEALLWVDSRYYIQSAQEVQGTCVKVMKLDYEDTPSPMEYMAEHFCTKKVGISADTLMGDALRSFEDAGINVVPTDDFLNEIWSDRPEVPSFPVADVDVCYAGYSREQKLTMLRNQLKKVHADATVISSLDDIAWLTNLRGDDIAFNPVFLSYAIVTLDDAYLFTSEKRFSSEILSDVSKTWKISGYDRIIDGVKSVLKGGMRVVLNTKKTNLLVLNAIDRDVKIIDRREFTTDFKAAKNPTELEGFRKAHLNDGVALVNFLASLDFENPHYDEIMLADMLEKQRARNKDFLQDSFTTIVGYQEHGAMCHYSASEKTNKPVVGSGLCVIDSGGTYLYGTTDVTRTLLFGKATQEQINDYTLVLKGHLALAAQRFPYGTTGTQLDVLARQYLWQNGLSYFHGTGHGVGHRLCVHEGPQNIGPRWNAVPFEEGMVQSDEPGIYKEGRHGIRIENLTACQKDVKTEFGQFMSFETLTVCPYERRLINKEMLTSQEIEMVDNYHKWVYEELKDLVDEESIGYLEMATRPL